MNLATLQWSIQDGGLWCRCGNTTSGLTSSSTWKANFEFFWIKRRKRRRRMKGSGGSGWSGRWGRRAGKWLQRHAEVISGHLNYFLRLSVVGDVVDVVVFFFVVINFIIIIVVCVCLYFFYLVFSWIVLHLMFTSGFPVAMTTHPIEIYIS